MGGDPGARRAWRWSGAISTGGCAGRWRALVAGFWVIHGATYIIPRYRDPVMPVLIALAADCDAARRLRGIVDAPMKHEPPVAAGTRSRWSSISTAR